MVMSGKTESMLNHFRVKLGVFSNNTNLEDNIIFFSFWEGLYFLNCDNYKAFKKNKWLSIFYIYLLKYFFK